MRRMPTMEGPGRHSMLRAFALLAALITSTVAQTWTDCNPMEKECPPHAALGTNYTCDLTEPVNDIIWNSTAGTVDASEEGGNFVIAQRLESTTIQSYFYIFFGRLEVHMKAASGKGIVSSIVLQSETLDEIDWEWVGSDTGRVQSNFYGKGEINYERVKHHDVDGPMDGFHNYTLHWTKERLQWWIDGNLTRTVKFDEPKGGKEYPQTPSTVRLGVWPAGDSGNEKGTIEWAGGEVDYDAGPYTMTVKEVKVEDFSSGKEYSYGDKSGSWESIKIVEGTSEITEEVLKPPPKPLSQRWAEIPKGGKIAIFTSIGAVFAVGASVLAFCCIKQRRAGRREYNVEQSKFLSQQNDNATLRDQWGDGYREMK